MRSCGAERPPAPPPAPLPPPPPRLPWAKDPRRGTPARPRLPGSESASSSGLSAWLAPPRRPLPAAPARLPRASPPRPRAPGHWRAAGLEQAGLGTRRGWGLSLTLWEGHPKGTLWVSVIYLSGFLVATNACEKSEEMGGGGGRHHCLWVRGMERLGGPLRFDGDLYFQFCQGGCEVKDPKGKVSPFFRGQVQR